MTHRLFVAIRPPEDVRDMLIDTMEGVEGARWQDEEQLHLTLHFIGDCDRHQANDVAVALDTVTCPAFDLALSGVGQFERKGMVHTVFAAVPPNPSLMRLQSTVEHRCRAVVVNERHRKYVPHVTIARANRSTAPFDSWILRHSALSSKVFRVNSFALYESHLDLAGARYEPVHSYALD